MFAHDTEGFRKRYRAGISRWYNAWLHGGFVFAYGIAVLVLLLLQIDRVSGFEWLALPAGLIVFNAGEYIVHREFGHFKRRIGALFYARHLRRRARLARDLLLGLADRAVLARHRVAGLCRRR